MRTTAEGCAALMLVLTTNGNGGQRSMFRNSRGRGLNLITLSMMPKRLPISQMAMWLRCFERSGHAMPPKRRHWPRFRLALRPSP